MDKDEVAKVVAATFEQIEKRGRVDEDDIDEIIASIKADVRNKTGNWAD